MSHVHRWKLGPEHDGKSDGECECGEKRTFAPNIHREQITNFDIGKNYKNSLYYAGLRTEIDYTRRELLIRGSMPW